MNSERSLTHMSIQILVLFAMFFQMFVLNAFGFRFLQQVHCQASRGNSPWRSRRSVHWGVTGETRGAWHCRCAVSPHLSAAWLRPFSPFPLRWQPLGMKLHQSFKWKVISATPYSDSCWCLGPDVRVPKQQGALDSGRGPLCKCVETCCHCSGRKAWESWPASTIGWFSLLPSESWKHIQHRFVSIPCRVSPSSQWPLQLCLHMPHFRPAHAFHPCD